jgi:glutamine amidotransferase
MKIDCGILDISISNKENILEACDHVELKAKLVKSSKDIQNSKSLIFPGNGTFHEAMKLIKELNIEKDIKNFIKSKKLFLGICLGMQLLFSKSDERGQISRGLGILEGEVVELPSEKKELKKPVIGWLPFNKEYKIIENKKFLSKFKKNTPMYFNNSCVVHTNSKKYNIYYTKINDFKFCSAVSYKNIIATQFHPELSSREGLKVYKFLKENILR